MSQQTSWRSYEEVAQYLLSQFAEHFGLGRVEGKQVVAGASGTNWEIDAKGVRENDQGIVVIECRRHTTRGVSQEQIAALAFKIQDTKSVKGIIVSPLPLQAGAKRVAASRCVQEVQLAADSTTTDYVLRFLQRTFIGVPVKDELHFGDKLEPTVIHTSEGERSAAVGNGLERKNSN